MMLHVRNSSADAVNLSFARRFSDAWTLQQGLHLLGRNMHAMIDWARQFVCAHPFGFVLLKQNMFDSTWDHLRGLGAEAVSSPDGSAAIVRTNLCNPQSLVTLSVLFTEMLTTVEAIAHCCNNADVGTTDADTADHGREILEALGTIMNTWVAGNTSDYPFVTREVELNGETVHKYVELSELPAHPAECRSVLQAGLQHSRVRTGRTNDERRELGSVGKPACHRGSGRCTIGNTCRKFTSQGSAHTTATRRAPLPAVAVRRLPYDGGGPWAPHLHVKHVTCMAAFNEDGVAAIAEVRMMGSLSAQLLRVLALLEDTPELANMFGLQWEGDHVVLVNQDALARFLGTDRNEVYRILNSISFWMLTNEPCGLDDAARQAGWTAYRHPLVMRGCDCTPLDDIAWHDKHKALPPRA